MRIETVYRFVNIEEPTEYIDIKTYGDGIDSNDKAPGKAMTYGDKYALLKAYKVITGEDPDQDPSEDANLKRNNEPMPPPKRDYSNIGSKCSDCGADLEPQKQKDGGEMSVSDYIAYCMQNFGRPLCRRCRLKFKNNAN